MSADKEGGPEAARERWSGIRVGTSGWSYEDWVGPFYPEGTAPRDFLGLYAERFSAVEVDSTFYAVPARSTFEGWAARTPEGFLFAPKVPGKVTHGTEGERADPAKVLLDEGGHLDLFLERASILGSKLGVVLFQFPYFRVKEFSLGDFLPRLERTLAKVPRGVRAAVEVRNKGWITKEYLAILEAHTAAAVLIDHPYMPDPVAQVEMGMVTCDIAYVRLLGDRHAIERKTTRWGAIVEDKGARLGKWADAIAAIAARPHTRATLVFSNNHFAGHAPASSRELLLRLTALGPAAGAR